VKWEVAKKNKTFKMAEVEILMNEELDKSTGGDWASCVRHAKNLQGTDFEKM
jgi:hypothetical protein